MSKSSLLQKLQALPLHPLFFAAYPVLVLFALISKDWHRAALLLSVFIFLFFTYGHAYGYLKRIEIDGFIPGRHRQMLPIVFGPKGEELNSIEAGVPKFEEYNVKYPDQVIYINQRITAIVDLILQSSPNPPVIVIQGDHGPAPFDVIERRMKNLNVYYFPDNKEGLYPTITPVNRFRLIFNKYFGQKYPMLEDRSLYSAYDVPYNYQEIPNDCKP